MAHGFSGMRLFFIPEFPLGLAMKTDALFERVLMRMRRELRAIRKEA